MKPFTPIFDHIAQEYNPVTALVYGYVWRCCQLGRKQCDASLQTIADDTGLSRRTVIRHIETLVSDGLIVDKTPHLERKPHIYLVTESHQTSDTESLAGDRESLALVTESHQTSDSLSPKETYKDTEEDTDPLEELVNYFSDVSNCRKPNGRTPEHVLKDDWLNPLVAIYKASGSFGETKRRIKESIETLRDKGYTVANPGSIQNTAVSMNGKSKLEVKGI